MFGLSYLRLAALAAIGLTLAGLFGWARIEQANAARYRAEAVQWQSAAQENQAALAQLRDEAERTAAALHAEIAARQVRISELEKIRAKIIAVRQGADGPVAPVLRDALEQLRLGAATDGHPGGTGEGARGAARVPKPGAAGKRHPPVSGGPASR